MSSCGNPNEEADAIMPRRPKFDRSKMCVRCRTNAGHIVIRHAVYCRDCFFPLVTSKFRKVLTPVINENSEPRLRIRSLRAAGNLTIAFSGGPASTVLLDLVAQNYFKKQTDDATLKGGKDHPRKNEVVWPASKVCYVEISNAFPGMRDRTEEIRSVVAKYDALEFVPLRIEDAFDPIWWNKFGYRPLDHALDSYWTCDTTTEDIFLSCRQSTTHSTPLSRLQSFLASLPTQTAILSSVQTIVRVLLLSMAKFSGSSHLLLGTTLSSLSISLISGIAQGSGFTIREEVQEEWSPATIDDEANGGSLAVRVVRPLRDIGIKECAAWAWWTKLNVVGQEKIPNAIQGIGALTRDFIVGLERDYPSTVSTIARTCGKLAPKDTSLLRCALCQRPAQRSVLEWKSRISIRSFAEGDPHTASANRVEATSPSTALAPCLCYACHTTLTSRSSRGLANKQSSGELSDPSSIPLPVWVARFFMDNVHHGHGGIISGAAIAIDDEIFRGKRMTQADMRERIGDYLIEE